MTSRALLRAGPPPSDDDDEPRDARPVKRRRMAPEAQPLGQRLQLAEAADDSDPSSDDEDDDGGEEGEEDEDEEEDDPRAAFRDVPLGDLARLRADGRGPFAPTLHKRREATAARVARANKNRPVQMSAKRPVPRLHTAPGLEALLAQRVASRDPRFDETVAGAGGSVTDAAFRKRYSFLYDEQLPQAKQQLRAQLKVCACQTAPDFHPCSQPSLLPQREKREERREALRQQLRDVEQSLKQETVLRAADARQSARHTREKAAVAAGKKPFYLKKAAAKQVDLMAKFNELKASGRLDTFLAKRRQKLATKDHVHAPGTRRGRMGREEDEP